MSEYTAKDILIKESSEDVWAIALSLSEEYGKSYAWIEQGLLACELANIGYDYFIKRYLEDDTSISMNTEVDKISSQMQKQRRNAVWDKASY